MNDDALPVISIHYESRNPFDLIKFMNSLARFGTHYTQYAKNSEILLSNRKYRLFIKDVRQGSIIVDLMGATGVIASTVGDVRLFLDFGKEFISLVRYFLGKEGRPDDLNRDKCEDIRNIMAPIADNIGAAGNFTFGPGSNPTFNISINHTEANAIQDSTAREIKRLKVPTAEIRKKVLLRWGQVENAPGVESGQTKDRAIIDSIDKKVKKVYFPRKNREMKSKMIGSDDNFFTKAYLVDVEVLITQHKIVGYKILKLHDI